MSVKEYEHLHFLWGEGWQKVYPHILTLLREYGESLDGKIPGSTHASLDANVDSIVHKMGRGERLRLGDIVWQQDLVWGIDDGLVSFF